MIDGRAGPPVLRGWVRQAEEGVRLGPDRMLGCGDDRTTGRRSCGDLGPTWVRDGSGRVMCGVRAGLRRVTCGVRAGSRRDIFGVVRVAVAREDERGEPAEALLDAELRAGADRLLRTLLDRCDVLRAGRVPASAVSAAQAARNAKTARTVETLRARLWFMTLLLSSSDRSASSLVRKYSHMHIIHCMCGNANSGVDNLLNSLPR